MSLCKYFKHIENYFLLNVNYSAFSQALKANILSFYSQKDNVYAV